MLCQQIQAQAEACFREVVNGGMLFSTVLHEVQPLMVNSCSSDSRVI